MPDSLSLKWYQDHGCQGRSGTQVNTIPLSRCCTLYPNKLTRSRFPQAKSLMPTHHTWISHDGLPEPFLGHFIIEVVHAKESRMYPIRFYVFEDATNPQILLSYTTLERLGIVSFQVPNLAATHSLNQVVLHNTPSGKRKTAKQVTFQDPISKTEGSHTCSNPPDSHHGKRKTMFPKGEEALTSSHCKTNSSNQEVKVGNSILSKTLPSPQVPNSPASKTIRCPTLANVPSQHYEVNSLLPIGAVTPGDLPSQCGPGMGHYGLEKSLSRLFWHHR